MVSAYFYQECPVCGRPLQVRTEYQGHSVICEHCSGHFLASDPTVCPQLQRSGRLLQRAEELLAIANLRLGRESPLSLPEKN